MTSDTAPQQTTSRGSALMLPGGGARGAYQVGVLAGIREILAMQDASCPNPFPIITGTSAGAINAAVLASHAADISHGIERLSRFWGAMRCRHIYRTDWGTVLRTGGHWLAALLLGRLGVPAPRALLSTTPLAALLTRETHLDRIPGAIADGCLSGVAITASGYTTSRAVSFFDAVPDLAAWERPRRVGRRAGLGVSHLMASSALPVLFPPARIDEEWYGDGGLRMTAPLSPAIHLGADRILVISTRDGTPDAEPRALAPMPTVGDVAGYLLDILFLDNLDADLARLQRVNETLRRLSPEERAASALRQVDTLVLRPSVDLRSVADRHLGAMPSSVRVLLSAIGAWRRGTRLPSYLLFEAPYCAELMALGRSDAIARREEIVAFLA